MSAHAFTEDQLVEQPAIGLFAELGWPTVSAIDETFGAGGTGLPRTYGKDLFTAKYSLLLEHVYEQYPERGDSVYFGQTA